MSWYRRGMGHLGVISCIVVAACSTRAPSTDPRPADAAVVVAPDSSAPAVASAGPAQVVPGPCRLVPPGGVVVAAARDRDQVSIEVGRSGVLVAHSAQGYSGPSRGPTARCTERRALVARRFPLSEGPSIEAIPMGQPQCPTDDPGEAKVAFLRYAGEAAYVECLEDATLPLTTRCSLRQPFRPDAPAITLEPIAGYIRPWNAGALGDTLIFVATHFHGHQRRALLFAGRKGRLPTHRLGVLARGTNRMIVETEGAVPFVGWEEPGRTSWRLSLGPDGQPVGSGHGGQPGVPSDDRRALQVGGKTVRLSIEARPTASAVTTRPPLLSRAPSNRALVVTGYGPHPGTPLTPPQVLAETGARWAFDGVEMGPDGPAYVAWSDDEAVRVAALSCGDASAAP